MTPDPLDITNLILAGWNYGIDHRGKPRFVFVPQHHGSGGPVTAFDFWICIGLLAILVGLIAWMWWDSR